MTIKEVKAREKISWFQHLTQNSIHSLNFFAFQESSALVGEHDVPARRYRRKRPLVLWAVAAALVAVLIVGGVVLYHFLSSSSFWPRDHCRTIESR